MLEDTLNGWEQACISRLQIFSDKSQIFLIAVSLLLYPLRVTYINFLGDVRRIPISSGRTVAIHPPVCFKDVHEVYEIFSNEKCSSGKRKVLKVEILSVLHYSISLALRPIIDVAISGFVLGNKSSLRSRFHTLLTFYVADKPEAEDILSVKRADTTASPCRVCFIGKLQVTNFVRSKRWCLQETIVLLNYFKRCSRQAEEKLQNLSMLSIRPVLSEFPLVGIHSIVDIYRIFRFQPLHNLSLGASSLLKKLLTAVFLDSSRQTTFMMAGGGNTRTFKQIRKYVFNLLNTISADVEKGSSGSGIHVDF